MTADAVGGVWNYALHLCAGLPEFRFVLAVMGPAPSPAQRAAAARLGNLIVEEAPYRLEWMEGAPADLDASRAWLASLARRYDADLLHVNGYAHARMAANCPALVVAHSDVLSWWRAVHREAAPAEWDDYRREVAAGLTTADRIVAPSRAVLDDLAAQYGMRRDDALVIANGIDLAAYRPAAKRPVVMAAGRLWDAAKNLALVDEVAAALPWPVEIAGPATNPEGGTVECAAARLLGTLSPGEMAVRLGRAAIFAAPAHYEPFGLGILEAAASGCALVLGDIPSLRENWEGAAMFVASDDRAAWRSALRHLIDDDGDRALSAASAQQRARAFSRRRMAECYAALYREMTAGSVQREVA
ncbi:MAG: glycosyltransferase [Alphaproteobacteria bacterium]|nr:glycosyltransferase [Alphaproteobacteria bacterium]